MADGSCLKNPVRTPWRETCRLGLGCLLVISVCPGCMHVAYGLYGLSTPLRDVSEHREYWGGYEVGATYILQQDVFIADLRYYSHGPGLAPGTEFPVDKRDPMWGGPTTAEAYRADPQKWPEMMGLVETGTRVRCTKLRRNVAVFLDVEQHVFFGEILDGPWKGTTVDLTELSVYVKPGQWLLEPNPRFLIKEAEGNAGSDQTLPDKL